MGKDLYHTIPTFFVATMIKHDKVQRLTDISDDYAFLFEIVRQGAPTPVRVWLNDAYVFTEFDFHNRPDVITRGDFILVARPEAMHNWQDLEMAAENGIGLGKIGKLMGALNRKDVWKYRTKEELAAEKFRKQNKAG